MAAVLYVDGIMLTEGTCAERVHLHDPCFSSCSFSQVINPLTRTVYIWVQL